MELKAKINKIENTYSAGKKQRMGIKVVNTTDKNAVVRIYEGEIAAANYITEVNVPVGNLIIEKFFTAQNVVFEIAYEGVLVALFHEE